MSSFKPVEGDFSNVAGRYAVVAGRWNAFVVDELLDAALETLRDHGIADENITVVRAPGAFEIPLVCQKLAESHKYDAIIALGAVIRGGTPHFEYVAGECSRGLARVALAHDLPVAFGVLTVDNAEQAVERAGPNDENKGREAALSALEMVSLLRQL